jgi:DNA-binding transcriptional LysR family regulator
MQAFVRVADAGSFAGAARSLGVSKAVVSDRIKQLEMLLRKPLFHRTTRTVRLSEAGAMLYPPYVDLVKRIEDIENNTGAGDETLRGSLRVACVVDVGISEIAPAVSRFVSANPELSVELVLDTQAVNPIDGGFDVAIHFREVHARNIMNRQLMAMENGYFASPRYVAEHGMPLCPDDLTRHTCITYAFQPVVNPWNTHQWVLEGSDGQTVVHVSSGMSANNGHVVHQFALGGHGIAVIPLYRARFDVARGALLYVLPGYRPPTLKLSAIYPAAHAATGKVQRLLDHLDHELKAISADMSAAV